MASTENQNPPMEWRVGLTGDPFDIDNLVEDFDGQEPSVIQADGQYWLRSTTFEPHLTADEVRTMATEMVKAINGAASIGTRGYNAVGVGHLVRVHESGRRDAFVYLEGVVTARSKAFAALVGGSDTGRPPPISRTAFLYSLAGQDSAVRDALRYWQHRRDSRKTMTTYLFKVWEVIGADVAHSTNRGTWRPAIEAHGWATAAESESFKSVHAKGVLGDEARHGVQSDPLPINPMNLSEAEAFIKRVMENWLRTKGLTG